MKDVISNKVNRALQSQRTRASCLFSGCCHTQATSTHTVTHTCTLAHAYTCIHVHTHACAHTFTDIHTHIDIHRHTYVRSHMDIHIHTHACTGTHIHGTHTQTHTYTISDCIHTNLLSNEGYLFSHTHTHNVRLHPH